MRCIADTNINSMIIKPLLIGAIEAALNHYLGLAENAGQFLRPLAGKVIKVQVQPFLWDFYLCPTAESIQLLESYPQQPDAVLTDSAAALGLMTLKAAPLHSFFADQVRIEGDQEVGEQLLRLFDRVDFDLEAKLAPLAGENVAHRLGQLLQSGRQWGGETVTSLKLDIEEYLQEESRDLPARPEVDRFYRQVETLSADVDRLQSRVEKLHEAMQNAPSKA